MFRGHLDFLFYKVPIQVFYPFLAKLGCVLGVMRLLNSLFYILKTSPLMDLFSHSRLVFSLSLRCFVDEQMFLMQ